MPIPKNKEKNRLYEPIAIDKNKSISFAGVLKKLVEEEKKKFESGKVNLIDYENLRKKAKEMEKSTK